MKEVLEFLGKAGVYYLATVEGDQPRVRPIGFVMEWKGKLAFCTGNNKDMCKQMQANPKVEIACYDGEHILRITGKAVFATCGENQRKALEVMPALGGLYAADDGVFEIYCLEDARAVLSTMMGESRELEV